MVEIYPCNTGQVRHVYWMECRREIRQNTTLIGVTAGYANIS